jgi:predicted nucleotidyltransferase
MDRDVVCAELRAYFEKVASIRSVYLFGSLARGQAHAGSDVDVAILQMEPPRHVLSSLPLDVEADLERLLGVPVQVVDLQLAPVDLVHRILCDGILVIDREPPARIRFEVRSRNEYFDLLPVLRRYRKQPGAS